MWGLGRTLFWTALSGSLLLSVCLGLPLMTRGLKGDAERHLLGNAVASVRRTVPAPPVPSKVPDGLPWGPLASARGGEGIAEGAQDTWEGPAEGGLGGLGRGIRLEDIQAFLQTALTGLTVTQPEDVPLPSPPPDAGAARGTLEQGEAPPSRPQPPKVAGVSPKASRKKSIDYGAAGNPYHGGDNTLGSNLQFRITPRISFDEIYDDNIFLTKNNPKGDFLTLIAPGVLLEAHSDKTDLSLDYTLTGVVYGRYTQYNTFRHDLRFRLNQQLARHLTLGLEDSFLRSEDILEEGLAPQITPPGFLRENRTPYITNTGSGFLEYRFGKEDRIKVGYMQGFLDNYYKGLEDITQHGPFGELAYWFTQRDGILLTERSVRYRYGGLEGISPEFERMDVDTHDADITYKHRYGPDSDVRAKYGASVRNFMGTPYSYYVHDGSLGVSHRLDRGWLLSLDAGYFEPTGDIDLDGGVSFDLALERRFPKGKVTLEFQRGWDEGFMEIVPRAFTRFWSGQLSADYHPYREMTTYGLLFFRKNQYDPLQQEEDDDTYGLNLGLRYPATKWFTVELDYMLQRRYSRDPGAEYTDNRVSLNLTFFAPKPIKGRF